MSLAQDEDFNPSKALYITRPKGYTVLNSSPEWYELTYGGNSFRVPPRTIVVEPHAKYPNDPSVPYSATFRDTDEFIPGTLVIRDLGSRKEGNKGDEGVGVEHMFQLTADWFLKGVFGVDKYDNITGEPFKKGLSILPGEPTKEQVARADKDGRQRYTDWLRVNAVSVIRDHENRNASAKKNDLPSVPESREVRRAKEILARETASDIKSIYDGIVAKEDVVQRDIQAPPQDIQEISEDRLAQLVAENPQIMMRPDVRKELSEDFNISKRKVKKSQQKNRPKAGRNSKSRKSAAIQVPVD